MKMAVLYPTTIALCMILLYIMPKSIAEEIKDVSENLSPRGVYKEVHIQIEDGSDISPRLLPELIVLLFNFCECSIKDLKCECCFTLDVFHQKKCCLKMQYLNQKNAVNGAVAFGGKTLLNFDVSATSKKTNLPECFDRMSGWLKFCYQFYGIRWDDKSKEIQMCSKFEMYLKKKRLYETDFGCFQLGFKKAVVVMSKTVDLGKELVRIKLNETNKNPLTECLLIGKDGKLNKKCV